MSDLPGIKTTGESDRDEAARGKEIVITITGARRVGKSTIGTLVKSYLRSLGFDVKVKAPDPFQVELDSRTLDKSNRIRIRECCGCRGCESKKS